ncbi:MAG: N-ethylammeline chlorohydrolase [Candidatus Eisenbacteria bacterium]|uniref:N-ethylammeline chlorohydrolase n=1 Tax=Eiseniibacteriota bacterium TaxID=2212470 RepID=A0A538U2K4_UNCEI|nr:MAG: N-ethylammeline chlorohydrolase [Candidatus Eisenbacteria bacterium]
MDAPGTVARGDLLIRDDAIAALGAGVPAALAGARPDAEFDAAGAFVVPGLVHGHLHLCQTLFRGLAEHDDLLRWLRERIWPLEAAHTTASVAASARLGLAELIAGGVTCINDMGTVRHTEAIGEALEASGIRAVFGKALMDQGAGVPAGLLESPRAAMDESLVLARRFHGAGAGRLGVSLAPRFILSCSEALWAEVAATARERGMLVHTHLAESPTEAREVTQAVATSAARYFAERDVLGPGFVGAHGVWLDDDELALLARADAALVHCPGSNLKLGSGLAHVGAWRRAGIRCGLGSDGAACNNRLDGFHEMSLAASLSRVVGRRDPRPGSPPPLAARDVLALATCDGARALGLGDSVGVLAPGRQADIAVVDARGPHMGPAPERDPYVALVHAARPSDVRLTVVAGRVLYRDGAWTTLDPAAVGATARTELTGLLRRAEEAGVA